MSGERRTLSRRDYIKARIWDNRKVLMVLLQEAK